MKKRTNYSIILLKLIFPIVFNIVFFLIFENKNNGSVWISYFFIHLSYLTLVLTPNFTQSSHRASPIGLSMIAISFLYFSIVFLLGITMIVLQPDFYKPNLILNIVITGLFGLLLIPNYLANETTIENLALEKINREFITSSSNKIKYLKTLVKEKKLEKIFDQLYDLLMASPVKSTLEVQSIEIETLNLLNLIENELLEKKSINVEEIVGTITNNLNKRNFIIKSFYSNN